MNASEGPAVTGFVPELRWLMLTLTLAACVACLPAIAAAHAPSELRAVASAGLALLAGWWLRCHRRQDFPLATMPLEIVAVAIVSAALPSTVEAVGLIALATMLRVLYLGWKRSAAFAVAAVAACALATLATTRPAGRSAIWDLILVVMVLGLLLVLAQLVVVAVRMCERRLDRDHALAEAALAIAASEDRNEIIQLAVCAAHRLLPRNGHPTAALELTAAPLAVPADGMALPLAGPSGAPGFLVVAAEGGVAPALRPTLAALATATGIGVARAEAHDRLRRQAERDPLTGLANRFVLTSHLEEAVAAADENHRLGLSVGLWVLLVDLNDFKRVNDTWGHPTGDLVLVAYADRISKCVREGDLVARLGGDEFALVVHGATLTANLGEQVAARIRDALRLPVDVQPGCSVTAGGSTGVASWNPSATPSVLLHAADLAMYGAKRTNRHLDLVARHL